MDENKKLIAKWQSRGGKHWVELYNDRMGYTYLANDAGGVLGRFLKNDTEAIRYMENRLDYFTPDKNKNLLERICI